MTLAATTLRSTEGALTLFCPWVRSRLGPRIFLPKVAGPWRVIPKDRGSEVWGTVGQDLEGLEESYLMLTLTFL